MGKVGLTGLAALDNFRLLICQEPLRHELNLLKSVCWGEVFAQDD